MAAFECEYSLWLGLLLQGSKAVAISKALLSRSMTWMADVYARRRSNCGFIRFYYREEAMCASGSFRGIPW